MFINIWISSWWLKTAWKRTKCNPVSSSYLSKAFSSSIFSFSPPGPTPREALAVLQLRPAGDRVLPGSPAAPRQQGLWSRVPGTGRKPRPGARAWPQLHCHHRQVGSTNHLPWEINKLRQKQLLIGALQERGGRVFILKKNGCPTLLNQGGSCSCENICDRLEGKTKTAEREHPQHNQENHRTPFALKRTTNQQACSWM